MRGIFDSFIDNETACQIGLEWVWQRLMPQSCYGQHMRRRQRPYTPGREAHLEAEWDLLAGLLVAWEANLGLASGIEMEIRALKEIRGVVFKAQRGLVLEEFELFELKQWLRAAKGLEQRLLKLDWTRPAELRLQLPDELLKVLSRGDLGEGGFYLSDEFSSRLAQLRHELREQSKSLAVLKKKAQDKISQEIGREFNFIGHLRISKLDQDTIKTLDKHQGLILVAESFTEVEFRLREDKQMLTLSKEISNLEARIDQEELVVREILTKQVLPWKRWILGNCRRLGRIDLLFAKARLARETGWAKPELSQNNIIQLEGFRHPEIAAHLQARGLEFQPVGIVLSTPATIVTGANMGGKSVSLKSVGLAVAMAQLGLMVPAKGLIFSLRGFIYYSQQEADPIQGLSTFGAEVSSLASVLPRAAETGLLLLDEPARGTNPHEGGALVRALVGRLQHGASLTLVSTHYQLESWEGVTRLQVAGLAGMTKEDLRIALTEKKNLQEFMDYTLVPGSGHVPWDALKVAAFLGLDPGIIAVAARELGLEPQEV